MHKDSRLIYLHLPTDCFMRISLQSTGSIFEYNISLLCILYYLLGKESYVFNRVGLFVCLFVCMFVS